QSTEINVYVKKIAFYMRLQQSNQQQQQQRRSLSFHTSKLSITQLDNSAERFREFDIEYFDFTCSESHDKSDYVTINDKIYYRDV
ncbi:MAG: hypothetical protein HETSPECPRED_002658, partial [Heterodermia speciosa]